MANTEIHLTKKKLNPFADFSLHNQSFWLFLFAAILFLKPQHYKDTIQCLGFAAPISSFIASKIYIYKGKKVEEFKRFSPEEFVYRKKEYMFRFFSLWFVWTGPQ